MDGKNNIQKYNNKNSFFLFSKDGYAAVSDYMRTLSYQILVFSFGVVFLVRSLELKNLSNSIIVAAVGSLLCLLFMYLFIGSMFDFINKSTVNIDNEIKKNNDQSSVSYKSWFKKLISNLRIVFNLKISLFLEFFINITFILMLSFVIFFAAGYAAVGIYKTLFLG